MHEACRLLLKLSNQLSVNLFLLRNRRILLLTALTWTLCWRSRVLTFLFVICIILGRDLADLQSPGCSFWWCLNVRLQKEASPFTLQRSQWVDYPSVWKPAGEEIVPSPSFCRPHVPSECQTNSSEVVSSILAARLGPDWWGNRNRGWKVAEFFSHHSLSGEKVKEWISRLSLLLLPNTHGIKFPGLWSNIVNNNLNNCTLSN